MIFTLIPLTGAKGYLMLLVLSNTAEFLLCYRRLKKYASFHLGGVRSVGGAVLCCCLAGVGARWISSLPILTAPLSAASAGTAVYLILFLLLARPLYVQLLPQGRRAAV